LRALPFDPQDIPNKECPDLKEYFETFDALKQHAPTVLFAQDGPQQPRSYTEVNDLLLDI